MGKRSNRSDAARQKARRKREARARAHDEWVKHGELGLVAEREAAWQKAEYEAERKAEREAREAMTEEEWVELPEDDTEVIGFIIDKLQSIDDISSLTDRELQAMLVARDHLSACLDPECLKRLEFEPSFELSPGLSKSVRSVLTDRFGWYGRKQANGWAKLFSSAKDEDSLKEELETAKDYDYIVPEESTTESTP